jgi:hypothetical protein
MGWLLNQILEWLVAALLGAFNAIAGVIEHTLLITPDVTGLPQVQALTGKSTWVVDSVFVLAFVAVGVLTMVAGGDERARYTTKDLLSRCVVGFIAAHFSQLLCGQAINLANAITRALTGDTFDGLGAVTAMRGHLGASQNQATALLMAIIYTMIVVLLAATAFQAISRLAVVLVLTAVAPIALACHALPQTDPLARLWWRAYAGCLAVPVVQAFTLQAGQWMFLDPRHLLPELPMAGDPGSVANLLIVIVLLWTTVKVPGLMRHYVAAGGRSPNVLGAIVRVVVVQQLTRAVRVPGLRRGVRAVTP